MYNVDVVVALRHILKYDSVMRCTDVHNAIVTIIQYVPSVLTQLFVSMNPSDQWFIDGQPYHVTL